MAIFTCQMHENLLLLFVVSEGATIISLKTIFAKAAFDKFSANCAFDFEDLSSPFRNTTYKRLIFYSYIYGHLWQRARLRLLQLRVRLYYGIL